MGIKWIEWDSVIQVTCLRLHKVSANLHNRKDPMLGIFIKKLWGGGDWEPLVLFNGIN